MEKPTWATLAQHILHPLKSATTERLCKSSIASAHLAILPRLALAHFLASVRASALASVECAYSVALAPLRHLVESLTIIELGLIPASEQLNGWAYGRTSQGKLRRWLESNAWGGYGSGLWDEPWSDFFGNLARAVQPYAHFSPELLQWQLALVESPVQTEDGGFEGKAVIGAGDESKSVRIALLNSICIWCLGRLILMYGEEDMPELSADISELGVSLAESEWLVKRVNWAEQLWPHVWDSQSES